jgi:hypothetical protein
MSENPIISRAAIKNSFILSGILAILLLATSLAGILRPEMLYPTTELRDAFMPNDVINLTIGLPALLMLMLQAGRGRVKPLLLWPGAVLFVAYNALAYSVALTASPLFGLYLVELLLSLGIIFLLLRAMDASAVKGKVQGKIFEKLTGWVLLVLGLLILFRNIGVVVGSAGMTPVDMGVMAADLLSIAAWVSAGICLLGSGTAGYRMGPAWMFQASLLFLSLLVLMAIQPAFGAPAYASADFVVVGVMSLICWIPFILQMRAIRRLLDNH